MSTQDYHWGSPPTNLALLKDDVHVWRTSLDQPGSTFQRLLQTLSVDERDRAERFHFERDRKRFIVGRGTLRTILGSYLGIEPNRLHFHYSKQGKPSLGETPGGETLRFNLAHSQGCALYAIAYKREVGIDLEWIHPIAEIEQIATRYFSKREQAVLQSLAPHQKEKAFFACWTRKEAYLKACGVGLVEFLDQIDVSLAPWEPARSLNIQENLYESSRWSLQELQTNPGFSAALAVEGHDFRLSCWEWSQSILDCHI